MIPRALVVDDDQSMLRTLGDILEMQGWEVTTASTGTTAVKLAVTRPFDVVLMDVMMPGMDGVTALKAIRELRRDLRVVLMTAYAAPDRLAEAETAGVMRILSKPVDIASLLTLLSSTIRPCRPFLLVDHDAAFLNTLSEVLRLEGFDTVVADNLAHAEELMRERSPAGAMLHLHLGQVAARDAVAAVHAADPSMALVVYSGRPNAGEEVGQAVPPDWIYAYLQKPFAVEQVMGVLNSIRDSG